MPQSNTEVLGAAAYIDRARVVPLRNTGAAKTLACHPASTTHRQLSAAELVKAGVTEDTVRLSIGIEHADDIIADIEPALLAA